MKYTFGDHQFETKKSAKEFVSEFLHNHEPGDVSEEDLPWVLDFFRYHPSAERKMKNMIDDSPVYIRNNRHRRQYNEFVIRYKSGKDDAIGINQIFSPKSDNTRIALVARQAIVDQILEWKEENEAEGCANCDCELTRKNAEVDHCGEAFCDILKEFRDENKISLRWITNEDGKRQVFDIVPHTRFILLIKLRGANLCATMSNSQTRNVH